MLQNSLEEMLKAAIRKVKNEKNIVLKKNIVLEETVFPGEYSKRENYLATLEGSGLLHINKIRRFMGISDAVLNFSMEGKQYVAHFEKNKLKNARPIKKHKRSSRKKLLPPRSK